jgi:hypothetical protein
MCFACIISAELRIAERLDRRIPFTQSGLLVHQIEFSGNVDRSTEVRQSVISLILVVVRFIHPGIGMFSQRRERADILLK